MKKQLLVGSALLAVISAFPQSGRVNPQPSGIFDMAPVIAQKFALEPVNSSAQAKPSTAPSNNIADPAPANQPNDAKSASQPPSSANWSLLCGSMNVYGMLVSQSRPLQYNDDINAVSFIHRKSESYLENPPVPATAKAGVIVAEVSSDWGSTWDSTCIWADATNWGRYPQGGIYSAPGNTNIANAYVLGTGPTVAGSTWTGNFYASKSLASFDNTPDAAPGAAQFITFSGPGTSTQVVHGWSRYGFSVTDDGAVRSLALIQGDNNTLGDAANQRGVAVVKGTFNAGVFTWTTDTLIPDCATKTGGAKVISSGVQMAWNESGTVGYAVIPGELSTATGNNRGIHPIVYKTTNSGTSWSLVSGIDFNAPTATVVTDHLASIAPSSSVVIPYMTDFDIAVDANDKLHIGAVFCSGASDHVDSVYYISQFTMSINPGHNYLWGHTPGNRPYVYDFTGDGSSAWDITVIDSIPTEDPGASSQNTGFPSNPWDESDGNKINVDNRLQLGRTPDGKYITYSWAESDTNFTTGQLKYNTNPNIIARCMKIGPGTAMEVSQSEIAATKIAPLNSSVSGRAYLHYMSPRTGAAEIYTVTTAQHTVDIKTPFTVTNNNNIPLQQLTNNTTWYGKTNLSYVFTGTAVATNTNTGVQDQSYSAENSVIYPNPAANFATLYVDMKDNNEISLDVYTIVGQKVKTIKVEGHQGENKVNIDLNNLTSGVYMVNVNVGNAKSTKKLIIQ